MLRSPAAGVLRCAWVRQGTTTPTAVDSDAEAADEDAEDLPASDGEDDEEWG